MYSPYYVSTMLYIHTPQTAVFSVFFFLLYYVYPIRTKSRARSRHDLVAHALYEYVPSDVHTTHTPHSLCLDQKARMVLVNTQKQLYSLNTKGERFLRESCTQDSALIGSLACPRGMHACTSSLHTQRRGQVWNKLPLQTFRS